MATVTVTLVASWLLQWSEFPDPGEIDVVFGVGSSAVSAFFTTLIVGAILVAVAPEYVERLMDDVVDDPIDTFVYGLLALVVVIVLVVGLFIIIVGLFVAIPLALVAVLVWAIGAAIAFLAIAVRLVDRDGGWLVPLLLAAALNGGLALTGIGGLLSFCIGAAGFGAVLRDRFG